MRTHWVTSFFLSICLNFILVCFHQSADLSMYLFICLSRLFGFVCLSFLLMFKFIHWSISLSVCPSVCLFVLSVCCCLSLTCWSVCQLIGLSSTRSLSCCCSIILCLSPSPFIHSSFNVSMQLFSCLSSYMSVVTLITFDTVCVCVVFLLFVPVINIYTIMSCCSAELETFQFRILPCSRSCSVRALRRSTEVRIYILLSFKPQPTPRLLSSPLSHSVMFQQIWAW